MSSKHIVTTQYSKTTRSKNKIRSSLFVIGCLFLTVFACSSQQEIQGIIGNVYWPLIFLSAFIAVVDNLFVCLLFQDILAKYNIEVKFAIVGQMYFWGQMAKYIPGRFWSILYHASYIGKPGSTIAMTFANIDITLLMIWRNIAIALVLLTFFSHLAISILFFIVCSFIFLFFSQSYWLSYLATRLPKRFSTIAKDASYVKKTQKPVKTISIFIGSCVAFLAANFTVLNATLDLSILESTYYISYFGLAWVVGVVAFIVPAGMGIRETVFIFLAQLTSQGQAFDTDTLIAIAVIYRFWQILHEIIGIGIGFILKKFSHWP